MVYECHGRSRFSERIQHEHQGPSRSLPTEAQLDLEDHGSRFVVSDGVGVIRIAYSAPDDCDLIHDLRSDFGNLTVRTTDGSGMGIFASTSLGSNRVLMDV